MTMKDLGIIAWAIVLSYLFFNEVFWYIWGGTLAVGIGLGIYQIKKNKKR